MEGMGGQTTNNRRDVRWSADRDALNYPEIGFIQVHIQVETCVSVHVRRAKLFLPAQYLSLVIVPENSRSCHSPSNRASDMCFDNGQTDIPYKAAASSCFRDRTSYCCREVPDNSCSMHRRVLVSFASLGRQADGRRPNRAPLPQTLPPQVRYCDLETSTEP